MGQGWDSYICSQFHITLSKECLVISILAVCKGLVCRMKGRKMSEAAKFVISLYWLCIYDSQIVHHNPCFNLFILHNNSNDSQGSKINKNEIFLRFDILSFTYVSIYIYIYIYIYSFYQYQKNKQTKCSKDIFNISGID